MGSRDVKNNQKLNQMELLDQMIQDYLKNKVNRNKEVNTQKITKIAENANAHYKEFVALMQKGVANWLFTSICLDTLKNILNKNVIKEMKSRYITPVIYYDEEEQRRKVIFINPNDKNSLEKLNAINTKNPVKVYNHSSGNFHYQFSDAVLPQPNYENYRTTFIVPINDNLFSPIMSSRQTKAVENCCKIINYLTTKHLNETNDKLWINIYGACQGIDFATKLVGSKVGKLGRINNAIINLYLDSLSIFHNNHYEIIRRIQNTNSEINSIEVRNNIEDCLFHPSCKMDNLYDELLELKKRNKKFANCNIINSLHSFNHQNTLN